MEELTLVLPERYPFDIDKGTEVRLRPCIHNKSLISANIQGVEIGIINDDNFYLRSEIATISQRVSPTVYLVLADAERRA